MLSIDRFSSADEINQADGRAGRQALVIEKIFDMEAERSHLLNRLIYSTKKRMKGRPVTQWSVWSPRSSLFHLNE